MFYEEAYHKFYANTARSNKTVLKQWLRKKPVYGMRDRVRYMWVKSDFHFLELYPEWRAIYEK